MKNHSSLIKIFIFGLIALGPVVANAQLKADFTADITSGCTPVVVNFSDLSAGAPTGWKWDFGNGSTSTEQNPGVIFINPGSYAIRLVVTGANGKDSVAKASFINVYSLPDVNFSATPLTGCAPLKTIFKNSSAANSGTVSEVIWDFGDGSISKETNPTHIYTESDSFSVTLSVINSYGCKQSVTKPDYIQIPTSVHSDFSYTYTNVCQPPAQLDFTNLSTSNSDVSYTWNFGDGSNSQAASPSHTYTSSGTYKIQLISKTITGCTDTAVQTVSIGAVKADFKVADSVCTNQPLTFTNTSSPVPGSVSWNFGDGTSDGNADTYHAYATAGTYTVTMNADFGSCAATATKVITVTNKPKAAFSVSSVASSCTLPYDATFTNSSTGAVSYKWIFGDGQVSTSQNPTHTYTQAGAFNVSLIAFNSNGCSDTVSYADLIKTGPPVIIGFAGAPIKGCAPKSITFNPIINSPVPIVSYKWLFGDGTGSTLPQPEHTYSTVGNYRVTLTVSGGTGCTTQYSLPNAVKLGSVPKADFTAQPRAVCSSLSVSFSDKSSSDVNEWLWMFGDGGTSTDKDPSHIYLDTGYFNITLIAKNNSCADTLKMPKYVQIFPPVAKYDVVINCATPYTRAFTDKSIGATTWAWDFGDGFTSAQQSPVHTYSKTGTYVVSLKVTNGTCESIKNQTVYIIDENPKIAYQPTKPICRNALVDFTASNYNPQNYQNITWNFSDGTNVTAAADSFNIAHQFVKPGTFTPAFIGKDLNGCNDTVSINTTVVVYGPTANFSSVAGACLNSLVEFDDSSKSDGIHPITKWRWDYGDGAVDNKTGGTFSHAYSSTGMFTVSLTVTDVYGCVDSVVKAKSLKITKPVANFKAADSLTCSSTIIKFSNTSVYLNAGCTWTFGDKTSSNLSNPTHQYPAQGQYTVTLVIKDIYGCKDSITKPNYITISDPRAAFNLKDTIGQCPPLLTEPKNKSVNYQSLSWQFGDGITSTAVDPQHYYGIPGTYTLRLIAKGYGNCYDTATAKVLLKGPWGTLNYTTLSGCAPTNVAFTSTSKNVAEYIWDFNNGVVKHTTDSAVQYNYTQFGSYLPKLVLVDAAGCKVSVENKDRIVISGVSAGIKMLPDNKLVCDSALRVFNDSSITYYDSIVNYHWSFGDNTSYDGKDPDHFYTKPGTYNVNLSITSKVGCTDQVTIPVTVNINKSPAFSLNVKDSACEMSPVRFTASSQSAENPSWNWNFGDNNNSTIQSPEHVYAIGGNYTATLKAISAAGCTTVKTIPVHVIKSPSVNAGLDTLICYGNSVMLKATGALNYTWAANASLSCINCANPVAKPAASTWYYATGFTTAGCKASDSVYVQVATPFELKAGIGSKLCLGQSAVLTASGADSYEWTPKEYLDDPFTAQPKFSTSTPVDITYTVVGKDKRNCFSDSATVSMKVYPIPSIQISNKNLVANAGFPVQILTTSSADITKWVWSPATGLNDPYNPQPTLTPAASGTYTVTVTNEGNCRATDQFSVSVLCDGRNVFIPNTFSPNNDGMNDKFFPHGKGIFNIKSLQVFNRWGQVVFQKTNFDANNANEGWDGTFGGKAQAMDVYVYIMEVICDNGTVNKINGNVTLLR